MSLTVAVFAVYFGIVMLLAVWSYKRSDSESDYWIAGGRLGWLLGGATLAATHASAGTFVGTIGVVHGFGWSFAWLVLAIPLSYFFLAAVLAPRFIRVKVLTLPAFLERRYDSRTVRGLSSLLVLVATVIYIQAQVLAGGLIAEVVFGIEQEQGMILFTAILIVYTVIGGMVAVVYTDLLQLTVMFFGGLLAAPIAIRHVGGFGAMMTRVQEVEPEVFEWGSMSPLLLLTMGMAFFLGSISTPEKLIRLYTMKDLPTIRRGTLFALVLATLMNFFVLLIALVSIIEFPELSTGDLAMPMIAQNVLPPLLGALLLAAITAAMMSTVDSMLLVAGSALSHDLYGGLLRPGASASAQRWVNRIGVLMVGIAPLLLLLGGVGRGDLVQFIVLLFAALMASSFFAPVVLGVFWRRATAAGAVAAMLGGSLATFAWKLYGSPGLDPVLPGVATSTLLFVAISLVTEPPDAEFIEVFFEPSER